MLVSVAGCIVAAAMLVMVDALVVSVVYHRYLTHRAVDVNRWVARLLTLYLQGMAIAPPLTWIVAHRSHHARPDSPDDPYSPTVQGFWPVLFLTPLLVTRWKLAQSRARLDLLARPLPDLRFYAACNRPWVCLPLAALFALGFWWALGVPGLVVWGLQLFGISLVGGWINAVAHTHGTRPHANSAVNRRGPIPFVLNLYMAGEWLHNHHHHRPRSANFGLAGELDPGYLACRSLAKLGLATLPRA
jgi:stearoyl-CoA desaturase (delta-9 desaturase)